jgi:hypothetical protein
MHQKNPYNRAAMHFAQSEKQVHIEPLHIVVNIYRIHDQTRKHTQRINDHNIT